MSILDSYRGNLNKLLNKREKVLALVAEFPDMKYHVYTLDAEIKEAEIKLNKLTTLQTSVKCDICNQWVEIDMKAKTVEINTKTICPLCIQSVSSILTTKEAEEKWGLPNGTIKQDIRRGELDHYKKVGLIRKSGDKYWLLHSLVQDFYNDKTNKKNTK